MMMWTTAGFQRGIIFGGLFLVVLTGCETLDSGGMGSGGLLRNINLVSTNDEVRLGQEFAAQVEAQEQVLDNPAIQAYVAEMGRRLASVSPRQDVAYSFKVIDAPDTVNAFALPGGYIYVYTGLMKICENEAELAAVLAHEIAHVAGRHHGEMMTRQMGMDLVADIILGNRPHAAAALATQLFTAGVSARYSRVQEREADSLGMDILYRGGYQPDGMITFMTKLLEFDRQHGGGRGLPIFATHPAPEERVQLLQSLIQHYPLETRRQLPVNRERYEAQVLTPLR